MQANACMSRRTCNDRNPQRWLHGERGVSGTPGRRACAPPAPAYSSGHGGVAALAGDSWTEKRGGTVDKKFVIAWVVLFVAWFLGSFVVHGVLLHSDYMHLAGLFRAESDQQKYFPLMLLAHVMLAGAFVWIYARGVEAKPWLAQGVRFGIAVALLAIVPTYLIYFAVQPMPQELVIKQIVFDSTLMVILGAIVAWLYRSKAAR